LIQSPVESSRQSSSESSTQSSFQNSFQGSFECFFKGWPPGDPYMRTFCLAAGINLPAILNLALRSGFRSFRGSCVVAFGRRRGRNPLLPGDECKTTFLGAKGVEHPDLPSSG
jgi:hypothetical protein